MKQHLRLPEDFISLPPVPLSAYRFYRSVCTEPNIGLAVKCFSGIEYLTSRASRPKSEQKLKTPLFLLAQGHLRVSFKAFLQQRIENRGIG